MEQKKLSKWLKCMIIGIGICGLIIYAVVIPYLGVDLRMQYPEFSYCFWTWLIFIWVTGIPCYVVLVFAWKIAANIGQDQSFSNTNAKLLKWISNLSAGDAGFFFVGNVMFLLLNMNHPSIVIMSFFIVFVGIVISVASAVLSHLVKKAAILQEQSDWTI